MRTLLAFLLCLNLVCILGCEENNQNNSTSINTLDDLGTEMGRAIPFGVDLIKAEKRSDGLLSVVLDGTCEAVEQLFPEKDVEWFYGTKKMRYYVHRIDNEFFVEERRIPDEELLDKILKEMMSFGLLEFSDQVTIYEYYFNDSSDFCVGLDMPVDEIDRLFTSEKGYVEVKERTLFDRDEPKLGWFRPGDFRSFRSFYKIDKEHDRTLCVMCDGKESAVRRVYMIYLYEERSF